GAKQSGSGANGSFPPIPAIGGRRGTSGDPVPGRQGATLTPGRRLVKHEPRTRHAHVLKRIKTNETSYFVKPERMAPLTRCASNVYPSSARTNAYHPSNKF